MSANFTKNLTSSFFLSKYYYAWPEVPQTCASMWQHCWRILRKVSVKTSVKKSCGESHDTHGEIWGTLTFIPIAGSHVKVVILVKRNKKGKNEW